MTVTSKDAAPVTCRVRRRASQTRLKNDDRDNRSAGEGRVRPAGCIAADRRSGAGPGLRHDGSDDRGGGGARHRGSNGGATQESSVGCATEPDPGAPAGGITPEAASLPIPHGVSGPPANGTRDGATVSPFRGR